MGRLRIASAAFSVGLAVGACKREGWFHCKRDEECTAAADGRCEPDDRCSFPDAECDSGRRYGEWAGDLSRTCVDAPDTTTGFASDTSSSTAPDPTSTTLPLGTSTTNDGNTTGSTAITTSADTSGSESTGSAPPQPLGHWPLDDGQASVTAADIGSGNHPGALVGGTWVRGRIGTGALQLDQEEDGVELGDDDGFALTTATGITLMGWARFDSFPDTNASLVAKFNVYSIRFWGDAVDGFNANVIVMPDGAAGDGDTDGPLDPFGQVVCGGPTLVLAGAATPDVDATLWHHYAGTYDVEGRWLRLFIDGIQVCEKDVSGDMLDGPVATSDTGLQLGRWRPSGDTLFGAIDDIRLYDVALSPSDIADIANEAE